MSEKTTPTTATATKPAAQAPKTVTVVLSPLAPTAASSSPAPAAVTPVAAAPVAAAPVVAAETKPAVQRRPRPLKQRILAVVEQATDTGESVYVPVDPPGLPTDRRITAAEFKTAVERAVYEDGAKQYGNKRLVVLVVEAEFEVPFEERVALVKPK